MTTATDHSGFRVLAGQNEQKLLTSFFVLYKTSRIVEENNKTFKNQSSQFFEHLGRLFGDNSHVEIKAVGGRYFVGEKLVRFDDTGITGAASVVSEWKSLGVGGVSISSSITLEELRKFFTFISQVKPNSQNLESLSLSLKSHRLSNVELLALIELDVDAQILPDEVRRKFRRAARSTFFQAVNTVQEVMINTAEDREINIARTRRVVHSLIDHITRDESSLIELTTIKDYDDYTYAHSTNVCIYSLTLGVRLNFDRSRLSQLGFTALFHDIGKVKLPTDLIRKPDAYDENDWIQMQRHPLLGAKTILRNMKLDMYTARAVRGTFEHHINKDFTGYPSLRYKKRPTNLFSKIISIVDTFDALTSGRVYLKKPIPPDKVLKKMHYQMKIKFDPFLLKLFTSVVGVYPAGSLVLLSTDEIALILTNGDSGSERPHVKIVGNSSGLLNVPLWVDLGKPDQEERRIVRMIDPERYGLNVKDFVLSD